MAHVKKFTKGACGHMFKHYERARDEKDQYINFGNQDIDTDRTHLNYNLAPERKSQGEFVKERCSEVVCLNRKDVNVLCSWVVTAPKDLENLPEEFFEKSYAFLENKYGKENVVSSYVHMDEVTPHMHFAFVPVVHDKKKDCLKVSAKDCINKAELKKFHQEWQGYLTENKIYCNVLNEVTREGNKSIEELKRNTAVLELENVRNEALKEVESIKDTIYHLKLQMMETKQNLSIESGKVEEIKRLRGSVVNKVTGNKSLLGKVKSYTMPVETYEACLSAQHRADHADYLAKDAERKASEALKSAGYEKNKELTIENQKLKKENMGLRIQNQKMEGMINKIISFFKKNPEIHQKFEQDKEQQRQKASDRIAREYGNRSHGHDRGHEMEM